MAPYLSSTPGEYVMAPLLCVQARINYRITTPRCSVPTSIDFYPHINWDYPVSVSKDSQNSLPTSFLERLQNSYQHQVADIDFGVSFWKSFAEKNIDVHRILTSGSLREVAQLAANPGATNMFWGFDALCAESMDNREKEAATPGNEAIRPICDRILRLAVATGALPLEYPEAHRDSPDFGDIDTVLDRVADLIGDFGFPNPFPGEAGLATSRGIASYRAIQSVYQSWRVREAVRARGGRVVEIGGGLGRTALSSWQLGVRNYTLIDIPLSATAQGLFLGSTIGPDAVTLPGEQPRRGCVRIETPKWFYGATAKFDVALNVDSLVEMDPGHANQYLKVISKTCSVLVSINHEFNAFRVRGLPAASRMRCERYPYWMRKGYVEEVYEARPTTSLLAAAAKRGWDAISK